MHCIVQALLLVGFLVTSCVQAADSWQPRGLNKTHWQNCNTREWVCREGASNNAVIFCETASGFSDVTLVVKNLSDSAMLGKILEGFEVSYQNSRHNVTTLILENPLIPVLSADLLSGFSNLHVLIINAGKIKAINTDFSPFLRNVVELRLKRTMIPDFPEDFFVNLQLLSRFEISGNKKLLKLPDSFLEIAQQLTEATFLDISPALAGWLKSHLLPWQAFTNSASDLREAASLLADLPQFLDDVLV